MLVEKCIGVHHPTAYHTLHLFKVTAEDFIDLCDLDGFILAPYLARYNWVHIDDISRLSKREWEKMIKQSYELIFSKLPVKIKK